MDELNDSNNSLDDNDWTFILFLLFLDDMNAKDKAWVEFEHELIYKNRFSSSHAIVKELHRRKEDVQFILKKGTVLYRARIFKRSQFIDFVAYYLKSSGVSTQEIQQRLDSLNDWEKYFNLLPDMMTILNWNDLKNNPQASSMIEAHKKWKASRYKGYNAKESEAPPADYIEAGRANPDHIRYLYLSEDIDTPIYEVRPTIGQTVSVARFKVKENLRIFDLTVQLSDKYENPDYELPSLFNSIGKMFSKPYNGQPIEYIPTQYVAEEIKNMGFDGIRFRSSLNSGGINIMLFSDENCKPFGSDLVTVQNILLDIQKPAIYHIFNDKST